MDEVITYRGFFFDTTGYAKAARYYVLTLDRLGVRVNIEPLGFFNSELLCLKDVRKLQKLSRKKIKNEGIIINHCTPYFYNLRNGAYKIGYTVFEAFPLPDVWIRYMNRMDEIWTASPFCKKIFENSGVKKPIFVIPHGVDIDIFNPNVEPLKINGSANFNFLSVFQYSTRKGIDILLSAYFQEFDASEDVALIIHTYGLHPSNDNISRNQIKNVVFHEINNEKRKLRLRSHPKVIVTNRLLNDFEMARLYRSADCFVLPSRGEGQGLTFMEAMACGLPTIGTRCGGNFFMNDSNSFLVEVEKFSCCEEIRCPYRPEYTSNMVWIEPCVRHLRELMRFVYEHREEAKEIGKKAHEDMKKMSWNKMTQKMINRIEDIQNNILL